MKKNHIAVIAALLLLTAGTAFAQNVNTANIAVTNLAWVDAEGNPLAEAHIGDTVYAYAAANIPEGAEVSVIIFEYNEDGGLADDYVTQLSVTVQDGVIRAVWEAAYDEEQTNTQCAREIAEKGWTIPRYRFRVRYDSNQLDTTYRSAFSAPLTTWGWVRNPLVYEGNETPVRNMQYTLRFKDGTERVGILDGEGYIDERRLPVGEISILIDNQNKDESSDNETDTGFDADYADDPFLLLCATGTAEEVRAAIAAGSDVNAAAHHGKSPLLAAVLNGNTDAARVLLDSGAYVNALDVGTGMTALMVAASLDDEETVRVLLDAGADIRARDEYGDTALDWAHRDTSAYALLRAAADALTPEDLGVTVAPYLTPEDMGIFIDNYAVIAVALINMEQDDEGDAALEYLEAAYDIEQDYDAETFWETFTVFLNRPAPKSLENAFKSIGWEQDGQKKFSTILYCASFYREIRLAQDYSESLDEYDREALEESLEKAERFLQVFHPADRDLIRSRIDDLL